MVEHGEVPTVIKIGIVFITILMCTTHRITGDRSTIEAKIACTTGILRKCECQLTIHSGTIFILSSDVITGEAISGWTYSKSVEFRSVRGVIGQQI